MNYVLDYQGKPYRKIFEDISQIPRGSFKEEKIAAYVVQWAKDRGLRFHEDDHHNVIVYQNMKEAGMVHSVDEFLQLLRSGRTQNE